MKHCMVWNCGKWIFWSAVIFKQNTWLIAKTVLTYTDMVSITGRKLKPLVPITSNQRSLKWLEQGWWTCGMRKDFPGTHHSLLFHSFLSFFCLTSVSVLWRIFVYIHISNYIENVYELQLITNNAGRVTFLHKSGVVRSDNWTFITGVPAQQWLGEYVTLDKTL
jgi:hypothetical protein